MNTDVKNSTLELLFWDRLKGSMGAGGQTRTVKLKIRSSGPILWEKLKLRDSVGSDTWTGLCREEGLLG